MMKNNKTMRAAFSGLLLLTVVAAGITMYGTKNGEKDIRETAQTESDDKEMESEDVSAKEARADHVQMMEDIPEELKNYPFVKESTPSPEADDPAEESKEQEQAADPEQGEEENQDETTEAEENDQEAVDSAQVPAINFTENDVITLPVNGEILLDYSMDGTVYFPTLDQYRYHEAVVLDAEAGEMVCASANGKISTVSEDARTGITVTMDMGNGYETVYGQLKDILVEPGQPVEKGTVLGYVSDPTKYYAKEGPNLYFAMKKDGKYMDPMMYTETITE